MKTIMLVLLVVFFNMHSQAQVTKVSLQASGLTCSMCSKAVLNALEKVSFVDKVQVDIKNQEYQISFKENGAIDFDMLSKAVSDAGFSVAVFKVTADLNETILQKDEHLLIGKQHIHFLNGAGQEVHGLTSFILADKQFTSAKNFKKFCALSKLECVQTGRMAKCCAGNDNTLATRVYHAII